MARSFAYTQDDNHYMTSDRALTRSRPCAFWVVRLHVMGLFRSNPSDIMGHECQFVPCCRQIWRCVMPTGGLETRLTFAVWLPFCATDGAVLGHPRRLGLKSTHRGYPLSGSEPQDTRLDPLKHADPHADEEGVVVQRHFLQRANHGHKAVRSGAPFRDSEPYQRRQCTRPPIAHHVNQHCQLSKRSDYL